MMSNKKEIYKISCHNEWCSGPETFGIKNELPIGPQYCPVCGWTALYGSGIKRIYYDDQKEEVNNVSF
jgi:hypothetical protein